MKIFAAAAVLVVAMVAPLALAQEGSGSSNPKLEVALPNGELKNSVSVTQDGSFWVKINGMKEKTHTVKLVDPDSGQAAFSVSKEFDPEDNWAQIFLNNHEHSLIGKYRVKVSGISAENPPTVNITDPIEIAGRHPRGFEEWIGTMELDSITRSQAAALSAVDRNYISSDFNPIPQGQKMTISEIVRKTRQHAKQQNGWAEFIREEFRLRTSDGIEASEMEGGGFFVTTKGTFLTSGTPNRDPVSNKVASNHRNIDEGDDCYADYAYRPPPYRGLADYDSIKAANAEPYKCPGYISSISKILPSQKEAANPKTYCRNSLSRQECIDYVIKPTCQNGAGPGAACQAMLGNSVAGKQDFGKWRTYCNTNFNKGKVKLNATEIVSCMKGCYGTAGIGQNGNFRQPEPQNAAGGMNCGQLVQNFCSNTKYATYVPKTASDSPNTCEVSVG
ncbi:MAG: hypothetical protein ABEK16_05235 [Candidatus Nanohalobium sp.]